MKPKTTFYLGILLALLFSLLSIGVGPALAQEKTTPQAVETLDTILARAAAKGFLTCLTRPNLADTADFYLLDSVDAKGILENLGDVTAYEITAATWINDATYQVKAVLQPSKREITIYTGKHNDRWQVEGLDLSTIVATTKATGTVTTTAKSTITPVTGNSSGKLVFQTKNGGDIYVINADGTGLQQITTGIDPQISPDGTQIAFTRWEPQYELLTINLDGSNERVWTQGWRQIKSPTWSADGTKIVFNYQDGGQLEEKTERVNLKKAAENEDGVHVPSGAHDVEMKNGILSYTVPADAYWHLKQIDLTTSQLTDLNTEEHSYAPTGHPTQANQVIYKGETGLAINNTTTHTNQPVTTSSYDHAPVFSPDGSKIAVSFWQNDHWEVHTMNADGSNQQRLTSTPLSVLAQNRQLTSAFVNGEERYVATANPAWNNAAPVWSPDGSQIAFLTDRTGQWEIWIMNADGSNQRSMFSNGALAGLTLNYAGTDEHMLSWHS